jgi:uncharacterized membrane protein
VAAEPGTTTARRKVAARHKHPVNLLFHDEATLGEKIADRVSAGIGSWWFLGTQSVLILIWITLNVWGLTHHWDVYPFILLNLMFTIQAAYTGPVLLLSGNRQAQKDRLRLEHTAEVSETAEKATLQILKEIERNTQATLKVLEHLKKRRDSKGANLAPGA